MFILSPLIRDFQMRSKYWRLDVSQYWYNDPKISDQLKQHYDTVSTKKRLPNYSVKWNWMQNAMASIIIKRSRENKLELSIGESSWDTVKGVETLDASIGPLRMASPMADISEGRRATSLAMSSVNIRSSLTSCFLSTLRNLDQSALFRVSLSCGLNGSVSVIIHLVDGREVSRAVSVFRLHLQYDVLQVLKQVSLSSLRIHHHGVSG